MATIELKPKDSAGSSRDSSNSEAGAAAADIPPFSPLLWGVCLVFPAVLSLWFSLDNSWPFWDAADHVRVEFQYADLLRHARPWNIHWLKDFLTVNYCYPATVHIFNGVLKAILGDARWVDSLSLVLFSGLLSFSTCASALLLLRDRAAAALSVVLINICPAVALLSHMKLLDYPHLAMFSAALFSLLWWEQKPGWARALICGAMLGLACTTKQIAPFFLFTPCLVLLIQQLLRSKWERALQLTCAGLMVLVFLSIWIIPNAAEINGYMHRNSGELGSRTMLSAFVPNFLGYINCMPGLLGYPLLGLTLLSLCCAGKEKLSKLSLPALSAVTGIICMSALPFQLPEHRYIANALLFAAILCASSTCLWKKNGNLILSTVSSVLVIAGVVQFIVQNFAPYPIPLSKPLIRTIMGVETDRRGPLEPGFNPTPPGDVWGQLWLVRECKRASGNQVCWLNMLPSTPELSVHTVELISRYEGSNVRPTTTRLWTPTGDRINFDDKSWKNFQFYLIKTGAQGLQFDSKQSEANYKRLEQLIAAGDAYRLVATKIIEDGSKLSLYALADFVKDTPEIPASSSESLLKEDLSADVRIGKMFCPGIDDLPILAHHQLRSAK